MRASLSVSFLLLIAFITLSTAHPLASRSEVSKINRDRRSTFTESAFVKKKKHHKKHPKKKHPKKPHHPHDPKKPHEPSNGTAVFLDFVDRALTAHSRVLSEAMWEYETNITDANLDKATEQEVQFNKVLQSLIKNATHHEPQDDNEKRLLSLLRLSGGNVAKSAEVQKETARLVGEMTKIYSTAKYFGAPLDPDLTDTMATSRDESVLRDAYLGWRAVTGPHIKPLYKNFTHLSNKGARDNDYEDTADYWRSVYDVEPEEFEDMIDEVWEDVKPLYEQLHCYIRGKLGEVYGKEKVDGGDGLLMGHLLGNMWAQEWANIYDLVVPYPNQTAIDITPALKEGGYDAYLMHQLSESFYVSLGYDSLPESFWTRSMLVRPADRDVVCHASAWDFGNDDLRIKMCTTVTGEDLYTIHHEQGHLYYDHYYRHQPALYRDAAADFFHEAIGDTILLSVLVPHHLQRIGLVKGNITDSYEQTVNAQLKMALSKVAILPWALLVDKWRWKVFEGEIEPKDYQSAWEKMVEHYQGLKRPAPASKDDFDAGAKFHVPSNVPYIRYFGAATLQFQLHAALCDATVPNTPLHNCSIYENKEAGELFKRLLESGRSREWTEVLGEIVGKDDGDDDGDNDGANDDDDDNTDEDDTAMQIIEDNQVVLKDSDMSAAKKKKHHKKHPKHKHPKHPKKPKHPKDPKDPKIPEEPEPKPRRVGLEGKSLRRYFEVLDEWLRRENKERGW
ncbi:hypothetical protein HK097_007537, partial [Rhizophlyctis rosea]